MAVDIIIRADSWKELISVIRAINYTDIPVDGAITMAICRDLQKTMSAIVSGETDIDDTLLSDPNIDEAFLVFWNDIQRHGFGITNVKIIDACGSILLQMESTDE